MTDRDLIKKLGNLKEIKPDASWLKANRDSLFTQISNSGGKKLTSWSYFLINFNSALKTASAPMIALASLVVVVFASGSYTHLLFSNVKPTDSLYIAREISEQAKLTTVMNHDDRQQLASKFAVNNAQDIATALSDPENLKDGQEVAKLSTKFNEEITTVKKTVAVAAPVESVAPVTEPTEPAKAPVQKVGTPAKTVAAATGSDEVFTATDGKDNKGMSLTGAGGTDKVNATTSTSTRIIEESQNLFSAKKYKEAAEVLNQLGK